MALPRHTTSEYDKTQRDDLGLAVTRAREAGGWQKRADFAIEAGISLRSLAKLEGGEEGVGRRVLEAVGRALPNWTEDTPYAVLAGDPPPPTDIAGGATPDLDAIPPDWTEEEEQRWVVARETLAALRLKQGLTRAQYRVMRDEYVQLEARDQAKRGHVTPRDRS